LGILSKQLAKFGNLPLRALTPDLVQTFFSSMAGKTSHAVILKTRDTLSSVLRHAIRARLLFENPLDNLLLPKDNRPRRRKPTITVEEFQRLLDLIGEPYASMLFVAVLSGLRVSELLALRWG